MMSAIEIIRQQMHLQRQKQSAMRTREIIGNECIFGEKKQNAMRTRVCLWDVQLQNYIKL